MPCLDSYQRAMAVADLALILNIVAVPHVDKMPLSHPTLELAFVAKRQMRLLSRH